MLPGAANIDDRPNLFRFCFCQPSPQMHRDASDFAPFTERRISHTVERPIGNLEQYRRPQNDPG